MTQHTFKDVAHLYVGCKMIEISGEIGTLTSVHSDYTISVNADIDYYPYDSKPLLRPISLITEEQKNEVAALYKIDKWGRQTPQSMADVIIYITKKGFDLFNLIESGEALDITTINQ